MQEDVIPRVVVAGHQIRCIGQQADVATVGADRGRGAVAVALHALAVDRHAAGDAAAHVAHEDVVARIAIAAEQIAGSGREGDQ